MFRSLLGALTVLFAAAVSSEAATAPGVFTVEIAGAGGSSFRIPLVQHGDDWRYRLGTNAPQAGWKTNSDVALDSTWLTGPGGFGYEDGDDATLLTTMSNRFSTLYIRREFQTTSPVQTNLQLRLTMDWDDGFIAWLDGVEVARSSNAPGAVGTEPAYDAVTLLPNHEASAGQNGNPPTVYNLGRAVDRLTPGTHVLAVMGLNAAANSADFSLIADLDLVDAASPSGTVTNSFFTLVTQNPMTLRGSNTIAGAAHVMINGVDAVYSIADGTWMKSQILNPGMNRLFVASLDASGNILAAVNRDIVYEPSRRLAGGILTSNTSWSAEVVRVTNNLVVPAGITLSVGSGTTVLLSPGVSITALGAGAVEVNGTEESPAFFLPAGNGTWGSLMATGVNASVTLRHAEIVAGQVRPVNGGAVLMEDSVHRDLPDPTRELIAGVNGGNLTIRRSYFARFTEVDARDTPVLIENCLFEEFLVDGVDLKATNAPLIVRNSTLRFGNPNNSNADAVDFGPGAGTVERCLIHGFRDKGVSIGGAPGTRVSGSLIYNCGIGISGYSSTGIVLANNTIARCGDGILFRNDPQPAVGTGTNLIVWGNTNNVTITNTSSLTLTFSDIGGGFTGTGNISTDPLFVNPAVDDYRLSANSPARGAGAGGVDMGATFPVGGIPSTPAMLAAHTFGNDAIRLSWSENSDNEETFQVERSTNGSNWAVAGSAARNATGFVDSGLNSGARYFYRVLAVNTLGKSRYSNVASAPAGSPVVTQTFAGGTLSNHTIWTPNMGMIVVLSNIIVPSNISLTILEGTTVKITNGVSIRATAGGVLNILGSESNKVVISRANTNTAWGELSANGTNASIYVRHADVSGGQTTIYTNATGLLEDSYFHHYRISGTTLTQPILLSQFARMAVIRRCHVSDYYETLFRNGIIVVEDSLFENISGDGLDFDAAQPGTVLRRCTFRNGTLGNVDAVDVGNAELGGSRDVIIQDCLMYNFPFDKGVSVGDAGQSTGTIVSNCLMYACLSGVQAKDNCTVTVYNCTIVDNAWGFTNYNKLNQSSSTGGGHTVAFNNILWNNRITISMWNSGTLAAAYCDLGNTNWPGIGNINVDPVFVNPAARDYRLAANSPCIGAGSNGVTMGVSFPVGGLPREPSTLMVATNSTGEAMLTWIDRSDNESGFVIEGSTNAVNWAVVTFVPRDASTAVASSGAGNYFRVRATNFIGESFASNVAAVTGGPADADGDGMPDTWEDTFRFDSRNPADAFEDADGDGLSNLGEYRAGTDPRSGSSRLAFDSVLPNGANGVALSFTTTANKTYTIQFRDSLSTGAWQELVRVPATAATRLYTFTDTLPPGTQTRFYRLLTP